MCVHVCVYVYIHMYECKCMLFLLPCLSIFLFLLSLRAVEPGVYFRRVMEEDQIGNGTVLLCQYLLWNDDGSFSLEEVTYVNGDNCVNTTAEVLWMQHISALPITSTQVECSYM